MDPAREAWMLLFQLFRSQRREIQALSNEFQLTPAQFHLLLKIEPPEGATMGALAEKLICDASYVTGLVDKLEDKGLVERRPDPADRRVKVIHLTRTGAKVRSDIRDRLSQPPPFIAELSESDKHGLRDILQRAVRVIADQGPSGP